MMGCLTHVPALLWASWSIRAMGARSRTAPAQHRAWGSSSRAALGSCAGTFSPLSFWCVLPSGFQKQGWPFCDGAASRCQSHKQMRTICALNVSACPADRCEQNGRPRSIGAVWELKICYVKRQIYGWGKKLWL